MNDNELNKFKNGELIVCCKSYKDAQMFINYCFKNGLKWFDGCNDKDTFWNCCKGDIYYTYSKGMLWWNHRLKDKNIEYVYK